MNEKMDQNESTTEQKQAELTVKVTKSVKTSVKAGLTSGGTKPTRGVLQK